MAMKNVGCQSSKKENTESLSHKSYEANAMYSK